MAMIDKVVMVAFALMLVLTPPLAVIVPLAMAPSLGVLALLAIIWWLRARPLAQPFPWRLAVPLLLLLTYVLLSAAWSLDVMPTLRNAVVLCVSALGGALVVTMMMNLGDEARKHLLSWFLWSTLAAVALCLFVVVAPAELRDMVNDMRPGTFPSGAVVEKWISRGFIYLLLCVPALLVAAWRLNWRKRAVALAVGAILVSILGVSLATMLALACIAGVGGVVWLFRQRAVPMLAGMMALWVLASPVVFGSLPPGEVIWAKLHAHIPFSSHHRLVIWRFSAQMAAEKPVFGWGFDAARRIPGGETQIDLIVDVKPDGTVFKVGEQLMPLHPHNAVMQWWLELGAVGVLLMLALLLAVLRQMRLSLSDRLDRAVAFAGFFGAFAVANVSFGFWQNWWLACLWLIAGIYGLCLGRADRAP